MVTISALKTRFEHPYGIRIKAKPVFIGILPCMKKANAYSRFWTVYNPNTNLTISGLFVQGTGR